MHMSRSLDTLLFSPIDLERDATICAKIRAETFAVSFGTDVFFWREAGEQGEFYLAALAERMQWQPASCVLAWKQEQQVGMLELKPYAKDPAVGYINTLYVCPAFRGQGWAVVLEEYCRNFFGNLGMSRMCLTVSPNNTRALRYYEKHDWQRVRNIPFSGDWLGHYNAAVPNASTRLATAQDHLLLLPTSLSNAADVMEVDMQEVWLMEKWV